MTNQVAWIVSSKRFCSSAGSAREAKRSGAGAAEFSQWLAAATGVAQLHTARKTKPPTMREGRASSQRTLDWRSEQPRIAARYRRCAVRIAWQVHGRR